MLKKTGERRNTLVTKEDERDEIIARSIEIAIDALNQVVKERDGKDCDKLVMEKLMTALCMAVLTRKRDVDVVNFADATSAMVREAVIFLDSALKECVEKTYVSKEGNLHVH